MNTTSRTIRASRDFVLVRGDGLSREVHTCCRCGLQRKNRSALDANGLCRDCRAVDPTFGQPQEVAQ